MGRACTPLGSVLQGTALPIPTTTPSPPRTLARSVSVHGIPQTFTVSLTKMELAALVEIKIPPSSAALLFLTA